MSHTRAGPTTGKTVMDVNQRDMGTDNIETGAGVSTA